MPKDRLKRPGNRRIMPPVIKELPIGNDGIYTYLKRMQRGGNMSIRNEPGHVAERLAEAVLERPREAFGESLPELALVTAIVAAVISATVALSG
jgi:hypothetical protein